MNIFIPARSFTPHNTNTYSNLISKPFGIERQIYLSLPFLLFSQRLRLWWYAQTRRENVLHYIILCRSALLLWREKVKRSNNIIDKEISRLSDHALAFNIHMIFHPTSLSTRLLLFATENNRGLESAYKMQFTTFVGVNADRTHVCVVDWNLVLRAESSQLIKKLSGWEGWL